MRNAIVPTSFLRRVWWADAAVSAVVGAVMAGAAGPLGELIGLPARLLAVGRAVAAAVCRLPGLAGDAQRRAARRRLGAGGAQRRLGGRLHRAGRDAGRRGAAADRLHRRPGGHRADLRRARVQRPAARTAGRRGALTPRRARAIGYRRRVARAKTEAAVAAIALRSPRRAARRRHRLDGGLPLLLRPQLLRLHPAEHSTAIRTGPLQRTCIVTLFLLCAGAGQAIASHAGPAAGRASGGAGRRSPAARCW